MYRKLFYFLLAIALLAPGIAGAVIEEDFQVRTTGDLIDLCTTPPGDPRYEEAIHFCHGYLIGAFHYYRATRSGPEAVQLVCFPDPPPTRNEAIEMFIKWTKAHPQYINELPVETQFRFMMEKWPCK